MGRTPQEAFFVKCDEETNPTDVIDAGIVVTLIGIAPVKPAEFIVFRISQYAGGHETETMGGFNG
jgi:phage tail sheath protein FI